MAAFWNIFKPASHLPEIQNEDEVKTLYKYWRIRILYSMFIGYALFYFTRKSFTFAMPGLIDNLGFDKSQLGILGSILYITYGFSKFASGILSDRSNPRYFMAVGLMITGVFNIFFGLSSSLLLFGIFWGLNGWFQGFGAPPCTRFLTQWYSQAERGSWWSTWSVSHNVGAALIPWIAGFCLQFLGWRYAMFIPGVICILGGFFLINRLRDTPQSLGLPSIEKFRNDYTGVIKNADGSEEVLTTKELMWEYVISNKYIWLLAASYFFVYVVRTGVNDWTALYLLESKDYSKWGATGIVSMFEVGGFFGTLFAGWSSDYIFSAKRNPVNVIFTVAALVSIGLFWLLPYNYHLFDSICLFLIGFAIFGPQMLIGLCAAELAHKKAAATANGFVGCFGYLGAAVAGYPLAKMTQDFGWDGFFYSLCICCVISIGLLLPMWNVKENARLVRRAKTEKDQAVEALG